MIVAEVLSAIESIAPAHLAFDWDHVGLQVGAPDAEVTQGVTCLDLTLDKAQSLASKSVVVAHHPLIWNPLPEIRTDHLNGAVIAELIRKECAFIAAHTNWDAASGGINDTLAARLGLTDVRTFGSSSPQKQFKVSTFLPSDSVEAVFEAACNCGAGVIGEYSRCSFRTEGQGTFLGSSKTNPSIGQAERFEAIAETKLEFKVAAHLLAKVEAAIRRAHPYEEPAIDVAVLRDSASQSLGRIGSLPRPMPLLEFRDLADAHLETRSQVTGRPDQEIKRVAIVGGAAGDEFRAAHRAGADVFLTGEIKHHELVEATQKGIATIEAGHYATEHPGMEALSSRLSELLPTMNWKCLASEQGANGRSW
ncbi:MAG: Nif3-like dinuclear metal center hexameric protein [Chthonomonas sp.]|nr:Nif3-like dinuclear metal center hexameric protein [Chthonomonas sp.]